MSYKWTPLILLGTEIIRSYIVTALIEGFSIKLYGQHVIEFYNWPQEIAMLSMHLVVVLNIESRLHEAYMRHGGIVDTNIKLKKPTYSQYSA